MGDCTVVCLVLAFLLSPLVLQGIGTFGSDWIEGGGMTLTRLNGTAYFLEVISFIILLLPVIFGAFEACINSNASSSEVTCCGICSGILFLLYPLGSLFSMAGYILIKVKFSDSNLGSSIDYCLASSLYILLVTIIIVVAICLSRDKTKSNTNAKQMTLETHAGAASPIEPGPIEIQIEERTTSLEERSEGGWRLVTQLNIFHLLIDKRQE